MVTEKEYCEISDLARVRIAMTTLSEIVPMCGHDVVSVEDWHKVVSIMVGWEEKLQGAVKTQ